MFQIKSTLNKRSELFKKNNEYNRKLSAILLSHLQETSNGGPQSQHYKHELRGKLMVHERINRLIDHNTPFLELSALAAWNQYNDEFHSAGIVTGIGIIESREAIIIANDATLKSGTYIHS